MLASARHAHAHVLVFLFLGASPAFALQFTARTGPLFSRPDIVLCVIDDVADSDLESVAARGWLQNLSNMAVEGVRFRRAYAHARCAPTRDSLLYSRWLGLHRGDACAAPVGGLTHALTDYSLAEALDGQGYSTLHVGKWHTGTGPIGPFELAGQLIGFDAVRYGVPIGPSCNLPQSAHLRIDDGVTSIFTGDNTIACRDAFLEWWASTPPPRFAMVNFASAHEPFKFPHPSLLPPGFPRCGIPCSNREKYEAEIVGVDTAMGDILAAAGPGAYVIFLGDNGTPGLVPGESPEQTVATRPDQDPARVKLTCYEDGVRVPLIVRGPGVLGGHESQALVHVIDVFPTLARILGLEPYVMPGIQGLPFASALVGLPGRQRHVFVWNSPPSLDSALIERRWKLLTREDGVEELYDLALDPRELAPLPPEGPEYARLAAKRASILAGGD